MATRSKRKNCQNLREKRSERLKGKASDMKINDKDEGKVVPVLN
jgi:hypothetical protein